MFYYSNRKINKSQFNSCDIKGFCFELLHPLYLRLTLMPKPEGESKTCIIHSEIICKTSIFLYNISYIIFKRYIEVQ